MSGLKRIGRLGLLAAAVAVFSTAGAAGQNVTGTWVLAVTLDAGSGDATFVLEQEGATVSGTYSGAMGNATVTGTVDGDQVTFSFQGDQVGKVTYRGTLKGSSMEGTCQYGQLGSGTFKGKKQP